MKPVQLAFPARGRAAASWLLGHASRRYVAAFAALALAAAGAGLGAVAWHYQQTREELRVTQDSVESMRARASRAVRRSAADNLKPTLTPQQSRAWNQTIRQLNTPWPAILDALEAATPDTVALVAIEPDARQGSVRLQAEAKTLDTLLAYAGALKTVEPFGEVVLIKHETNDQDSTRPVRLSMDARLRAPNGSPVKPEAAR